MNFEGKNTNEVSPTTWLSTLKHYKTRQAENGIAGLRRQRSKFEKDNVPGTFRVKKKKKWRR